MSYELKAREIFDQFASINPKLNPDEKTLNLDQFTTILAPFSSDVPRDSYSLLYLAADHERKGYIDEKDWVKFTKILTSKDGEFKLTFNLIGKDTAAGDKITYTECIEKLNKINRAIDPSYQQKTVKLNWTYFTKFFAPHGFIEYSDFVTLINYLPITKLIGNFEMV